VTPLILAIAGIALLAVAAFLTAAHRSDRRAAEQLGGRR
jgi:hypothetical protein